MWFMTPVQVLTSSDLQAYLSANHVTAEIIHCDIPTPTVEAAAGAMGTLPERIVKSILFVVREEPVLAIACGTSAIERRAIAALFGVGSKQVKLAPSPLVLELTGYPAGAVPPLGHRRKIPTLIDLRVLAQPEVYAGGGEENALLRIAPVEIQRLTGARAVDLQAASPPG
jgi:prolyl-tRNA editing enzyme YbaK/EbsC (Cys-tRNA(Pro) deacylase)